MPVTGSGVALQAHFQHVIVAVAVGIGRRAEAALVFLVGKLRAAADVGGRKFHFAGDQHAGLQFDVLAGTRRYNLIIVFAHAERQNRPTCCELAIGPAPGGLCVYVIYAAIHERVVVAGDQRAGFHHHRR